MTAWISPFANWASLLYRNNSGQKRIEVIEDWLRRSRGWLPGLQTILPDHPRPTKHERYLLGKTPELEIWLIAWGEKASTPFLEHAGEGCWSRVIQGTLFKETCAGFSRLSQGDTTYIEGSRISYRLHTLDKAYSLQIVAAESMNK